MGSRSWAAAGGLAVAGLSLAVAGGLAQAAQASQGARPVAAMTTVTAATAVALPHAAKLLHNQYNNTTGYGNGSQDFGKGNADNSQGADDFTVPKGQTWTITEVKVAGFYSSSGASATSENVFFYKTKIKKKEDIPGALVKKVTLKGKAASGPPAAYPGSFAISGIKGVSLAAGHYWVSVQANLASSAGDWYWESRTKQSDSPAVWRNPGGGDGIGCTTWTSKQTCFGSTGRPDFMFALYGGSKG
jgi:hypothetical protein